MLFSNTRTSYEEIVKNLETLEEGFSQEILAVRTGRKDEQDLTAVLKAHGGFLDKDLIQELRRGLAQEKGESLEDKTRVFYALLGLWLYRELSEKDDQFQTLLSRRTVSVAGEDIPYYNLHARIVSEKNFEKREELGQAIESVHAAMTPQALELRECKQSLLASDWGYTDYRTYCSEKKQMDYGAFAEILKASLARLEPLYLKTAEEWTKKKLGKPFGSLSRWHASYILKLDHLDTLFPRASMLERLHTSLECLGLSFKQFPNIHLDLEDRPSKNPRAFCLSLKIPQEIYLVLKPVGGISDYETFLHEAGHALHHGNTSETLPYPLRHLARSYALTETYAFLLQNLTMEPLWLETCLGLSPAEARDVRRSRIFLELYMYLRYVAKFLFEYEFYGAKDFKNGKLYADKLSGILRFRYEPTSYLFDMDSEFYSADYLRAWIAEAQLSEILKARFKEDWFLKKDAGGLLQDLWRRGDKPSLEPLISELALGGVEGLGGKPFDLGPLEKRFQELKQ